MSADVTSPAETAAEPTVETAPADPTAETPGTATEPLLRRLWRSDFTKALVLALAWQALMTVFGALFDLGLPMLHNIHYPPGFRFDPQVLAHTYRQDSGWFGMAMDVGYGTDYRTSAFFPLFPMTALLVKVILGGTVSNITAGLLVNTVATWLTITALLRITREFTTRRGSAWLAVGLLLSAPVAYYLHMFYSEALFMALGSWAFLFALRRRWVCMGLCLLPITADRVTAVLFVGLCFLEFWRAKSWRLRGLLSWHLLWFPAAAGGFVAYAGLLAVQMHDPLGMTKAYSYWSYHQFDPNIVGTLYRQVQLLGNVAAGRLPMNSHVLGDEVLGLAALLVLVVSSVYLLVALRGRGVPLGVFGLVSFVMLTLNSNTVSVCRYVLPCISVYVALAVLAERSRAGRPLVFGLALASALAQGVLYLLFVDGWWIA